MCRWRSWVAGEEKELDIKRPSSGRSEAARQLLVHLSEAFVNIGLCGKTKREVIEELVDHVRSASDQRIDRTQALQVLGERERLASTGLGNGIAILHCRLMGLEKPVLAFGLHNEGVAFGGIDNTPSNLFLLMLTCARNPGEHLRLLAAAARILGDQEIRERLCAAQDAVSFLNILRDVAKE